MFHDTIFVVLHKGIKYYNIFTLFESSGPHSCFRQCTVDQEFFAGNIFRRFNFHVVLFYVARPLDKMNLLYLFVEENISLV